MRPRSAQPPALQWRASAQGGHAKTARDAPASDQTQTVVSSPPEASHEPSGAKASADTALWCAGQVRSSLPLPVCHSSSVPEAVPPQHSAPSGVAASAHTASAAKQRSAGCSRPHVHACSAPLLLCAAAAQGRVSARRRSAQGAATHRPGSATARAGTGSRARRRCFCTTPAACTSPSPCAPCSGERCAARRARCAAHHACSGPSLLDADSTTSSSTSLDAIARPAVSRRRTRPATALGAAAQVLDAPYRTRRRRGAPHSRCRSSLLAAGVHSCVSRVLRLTSLAACSERECSGIGKA
jgi:hypothetical protein